MELSQKEGSGVRQSRCGLSKLSALLHGVRKDHNTILMMRSMSIKKTIFSTFPLLGQMRSYKISWIWPDFWAGIIVACFHIPQSMGTGMAANLGAMYGIYMTFFPGLIYALMGTSIHNSMGAFAPTAALIGVGIARTRLASASNGVLNSTGELISFAEAAPEHLRLAVTRTFCAGVAQILMGIFRLDFLSRLFSHNVLDPFNCACSLQIMLVQIPNMLGVPLLAYFGLNKHIRMLELLFRNIAEIRWADTLFAVLSASTIIGFREFVQPQLIRRGRFVVPIEFLVMVIATVLSYCFDMSNNYGIILMGDMPVGIPEPTVPTFTGMPYPAFEGILTALVSIAMSMQAAKVLARKCSYEVSTKQELRAIGAANIFGSFFSCFVATSAVGRNLIAEQLGARSQLSSLFGCLLTGLLLAFASQTLYYLPFSVIATIIVLTLAMSLKMFGDLPRLYRTSKIDAAEWILTFISCCLLDVEWGLLVGLVFSWLVVIYRTQRPRLLVLGRSAENEGLYVPVKYNDTAAEVPGITIIRITNNFIHYANAEYFFRKTVDLAIGTRRKGSHKLRPTIQLENPESKSKLAVPIALTTVPADSGIPPSTQPTARTIKAVILDFSAVSSVDSTGLRALEQLGVAFSKRDIPFFIANCRERHLKRFERFGLMGTIPRDHFVHYIHDGVTKALSHVADAQRPSQKDNVEETEDASNTFWNVPGMQIEGLEYGEDFDGQMEKMPSPVPQNARPTPSGEPDNRY